ncbi:type II toxin-antitoxin system HicA family toxin [Candidatus Uhrbacteria bacterium]|nr:type II toxin-antitoxin system HicA family toxin [Candidatus Uhrbacteria bacterium]
MPKLAEVMPKDLLKALLKGGFVITNQSGSHVRLHHFDGRKTTLAVHAKPLPKGTLASILRHTQISREELEHLL